MRLIILFLATALTLQAQQGRGRGGGGRGAVQTMTLITTAWADGGFIPRSMRNPGPKSPRASSGAALRRVSLATS